MATPDTSPTALELPAAGRYVIDPDRSGITFATKHMFGLGGVTGKFALTAGEFIVGDPLSASTASAEAAAASFDSSNPKRDEKVKSGAFLDVANHSAITFTSTGARQENAGWILTGTLTARGQSAPVDLTLTSASSDSGAVTVTATGTVDRYAHGITKMKGMAGRTLDLTITAVATPAA